MSFRGFSVLSYTALQDPQQKVRLILGIISVENCDQKTQDFLLNSVKYELAKLRNISSTMTAT